MSKLRNLVGISTSTFIAGLVVAILVSSLLSIIVITTLWARGPQGETGSPGPQGETGPQGSLGVLTVENLSGWLPAPAWDGGWTNATDQTPGYPVFLHSLNTTNVLIHIQANGTQTIEISWYTESEIRLVRSTPNER